eukprot:TRINITY_DN12059_c0_g1_i1.p1 TRINITY_DN12059_c0_g1~~TRINITY_DN12059_c0_g1_i1.p1  ORF type:complete len:1007 (+),score=239.48 TRINITY_DN12059_c0_g1_i1:55-3021(+)
MSGVAAAAAVRSGHHWKGGDGAESESETDSTDDGRSSVTAATDASEDVDGAHDIEDEAVPPDILRELSEAEALHCGCSLEIEPPVAKPAAGAVTELTAEQPAYCSRPNRSAADGPPNVDAIVAAALAIASAASSSEPAPAAAVGCATALVILAYSAAGGAAGKPKPPWALEEFDGMLPFRVERTAFPKSRFDTIRFFTIYEDPNTRNTGILYVPKHNKQRMLYFRIHKAVRHACVHGAFRRAGMRETKRDKWNVLWGKRWKDDEYLTLNPFQKVNHFPGTWHIGRKDMLFRNLQRMRRIHGPQAFGFCPQTFLLPHDATLLANEMEAGKSADTRAPVFIVKPPASSCGRGIYLISHPSEIPREDSWICQRYIANPLLIAGYKCDLRLYAAITSFDPLRIYLLQDGLVRFATEKYKRGESHLQNRYMHLTNYSVNKKSAKFKKNTNADEDDTGSKWSLRGLKRYFKSHKMDWDSCWARIKDCIIKTVLSCEAIVASKVAMFVKYRGSCYELYGFDVLLDSDLMPYILEVNIMPALACGSPLDKKIKGTLVANLLNLVGVQPYDRKHFMEQQEMRKRKRLLGFNSSTLRERSSFSAGSSRESTPTRPRSGSRRGSKERAPSTWSEPTDGADPFIASLERRWWNNVPICSGKGKASETLTQASFASLDELDKEIIRDTEDEYQRRGLFERVFPTRKTGELYNPFFEQNRYYNQLLWLWEKEKARCDESERRMLLAWLRQEGPYPSALPQALSTAVSASPADSRRSSSLRRAPPTERDKPAPSERAHRGRPLQRSPSTQALRRVSTAPYRVRGPSQEVLHPRQPAAQPAAAAEAAPAAAPAADVDNASTSSKAVRPHFGAHSRVLVPAASTAPFSADKVSPFTEEAAGPNPNRGHHSASLLVSPATVATRWRACNATRDDVVLRFQPPTTIVAPRPADGSCAPPFPTRPGAAAPNASRVSQRFERLAMDTFRRRTKQGPGAGLSAAPNTGRQ